MKKKKRTSGKGGKGRSRNPCARGGARPGVRKTPAKRKKAEKEGRKPLSRTSYPSRVAKIGRRNGGIDHIKWEKEGPVVVGCGGFRGRQGKNKKLWKIIIAIEGGRLTFARRQGNRQKDQPLGKKEKQKGGLLRGREGMLSRTERFPSWPRGEIKKSPAEGRGPS